MHLDRVSLPENHLELLRNVQMPYPVALRVVVALLDWVEGRLCL